MIYISFDIGVKNLAVCIIKKTDILEILDWRIIALASSKKEIKGIEDISERIYIEMDNIIGNLKNININMIEYVLIENQPSNLNGIMKTIQHIIYGYFSLIKYWDKEVGSVVLVNASLKTKNHKYIINIESDDKGDVKNKKGFRRDKYKMNKMLSIELCREYISEDEDLKKFINMFMGLNESLNNEKIFYALINLNTTVAGKEEKNRFNDNLNKIIISVDGLKDYKLFKDISKVLKSFRENIDTYSDTVLNIQKEEGEKHGSSDYIWGDKLLDQSFSMNNIKLIKDSIKKLSFFGKVSSIKENLLRMNKEHKYHQEDYGKLLGKSIGAKLSELNKEYVENIDRLNDKLRGRGYLLDQHNASKSPTDQDYLPRGLVENIYKIQYEAKEGLYKTVETIDLYLMDFTELLSGNPDAIMDLNKMLEQTEIIAKWFTKKSVDNLSDLFTQNIDYNEPTDIDDKISDLLQKELNLPPLLQSKTIFANKIKIAYEQCKKSIDSIAILKNKIAHNINTLQVDFIGIP